ncbi:MAG: hypothetical protein IJ558_05060 [Treponema sp.]|nr:hypothetical protein [Treponema sp.]
MIHCNKSRPCLKKPENAKKWGGSEVPAKIRFEERSVPKGFNRGFSDGFSLGAPFFCVI